MKTLDTCLVLVLPLALEEPLVDHLLEHPEWVGGYTIVPVEGRGQAVRLHGPAEAVSGRARRVQITAVMAHDDVAPLIAHLRETLHGPDVAWWTLPVTGFGRFG